MVWTKESILNACHLLEESGVHRGTHCIDVCTYMQLQKLKCGRKIYITCRVNTSCLERGASTQQIKDIRVQTIDRYI